MQTAVATLPSPLAFFKKQKDPAHLPFSKKKEKNKPAHLPECLESVDSKHFT
jgi:hypothetical protein